MSEIFERIYNMTAISNIIAEPQFLIMYALAFLLLYLGIKKQYEPLLLIPIAFGVLIANFPGGGMGVLGADGEGLVHYTKDGVEMAKNVYEMSLPEIAHDLGIMNFIYYALIKSGLLPPIIFMGVGALTDFGPMLRNLKLAIFGAGAQFGIFAVLIIASYCGFTMQEAGSLAIIGGADGPTAIFTTIKLAPHLLGPIAIAAYSYMALVPVIIPLVVKLTCSEKELKINMKEQDKLYPNAKEFKNMRALKIIFPIATTTVVAILVPTAVPLVGMLMFGNAYLRCRFERHNELCHNLPWLVGWRHNDCRCLPEPSDNRHCGWRILRLRPVNLRWHSAGETLQPVLEEENQPADWRNWLERRANGIACGQRHCTEIRPAQPRAQLLYVEQRVGRDWFGCGSGHFDCFPWLEFDC